MRKILLLLMVALAPESTLLIATHPNVPLKNYKEDNHSSAAIKESSFIEDISDTKEIRELKIKNRRMLENILSKIQQLYREMESDEIMTETRRDEFLNLVNDLESELSDIRNQFQYFNNRDELKKEEIEEHFVNIKDLVDSKYRRDRGDKKTRCNILGSGCNIF